MRHFISIRSRTAAWTLLIAASCFTAHGQLVATKDLTKQPEQSNAQPEKPAPKFCVNGGTISDGVVIEPDPPVLTISIKHAEIVVRDQKIFVHVTLMLKNHGVGPAIVPWSESEVEQVETAKTTDSRTLAYDLATVEFFVGEPFHASGDIHLAGHVALWAQPDNAAQTIKLQAGQWTEIESNVSVECARGTNERCLARLQSSPLEISAWWYERKLTTTMKGDCIEGSGAYTLRELESKSVTVSGTPISSQPK